MKSINTFKEREMNNIYHSSRLNPHCCCFLRFFYFSYLLLCFEFLTKCLDIAIFKSIINKLDLNFMKLNYKNQTFPVIMQEDETGGYVVINPAIDGCYSQGETIEDALKNIKEATKLCLEETAEKCQKIKLKNISIHLINLQNKYA